MKKLNHVYLIGVFGIFAAGFLTQGTPTLAAQNTPSSFVVAQKSLNPEEIVTLQSIYFVNDPVYVLAPVGGTFPGNLPEQL